MEHKQLRWFLLIGLALVWGSSFILMKLSLQGLSAIQVGALRMIISAVFLLSIGFNKLKLIHKRHWKYIFLNAILGTFFPVFLFAFAVQHIDSGVVAILNSLTPLNTLILGFFFFGFIFRRKQILGVIIGMLGTVFLIVQSANVNPDDNYWFALTVIIASIGYAFNVNILKKYLADLDATAIAVGNFLLVVFPAIIVLISTGFFRLHLLSSPVLPAIGYMSILAIVGTALAKIFFNRLVQISSPVFASSVTYLIPVVALIWGFLDDEHINILQILAGILILFGVYLVNKKD
ncbi:MAG TPA: DMT family transporter [Arcobacter sp.]|nr:DMT family transporter [Arcobacter sp.]